MSWLRDLETLVTINSYTKNKAGVDHVSRVMEGLFSSIGFETVTYQRELLGDHVLFKSARKEGKKVLLLGHNDTVFPPDTFENFCEDEQWVYGPGVCDMKGGNIVAFHALKRLYKAHGVIHNIDMLLVSDEETGSDDSKFLTRELASVYDYCFVYEASGKQGEVVTGRKGVGTFNIEIKGLAAHAGNHYVDGCDANLEASYKLQRLVALTDLDKQTTVNVGKIEGGIGANTISPKASLLFELRYTQEEEKDRVLSVVDDIVSHHHVKGVSATLSGGIQRDVMVSSDVSLAFVERLSDLIGNKILTEQRGGVSDANIVSGCGVLTLDGFGPFGDGDHTVSERALKSTFEKRIEMSRKILERFLNKGEL